MSGENTQKLDSTVGHTPHRVAAGAGGRTVKRENAGRKGILILRTLATEG